MTGRNPVDAVRHGLSILAVVWQGLWLVSEWLGQGFESAPTTFLLVLVTASWVGLIAATWWLRNRAQWIAYTVNFVVLAAVALAFLLGDGTAVGLSVANLFVGLAGVLLGTRLAVLVVFITMVAEFFVLQTVSSDTDTTSDLLSSAYLATIGVGALLARLALLRGARNAMVAQHAAADEAVRARTHDAVAQRNLESERVVHETVLNTLTALGRGVVSDPQTIRERAREGADVLRAVTLGQTLQQDSIGLNAVLTAEADRLQAAGMTVDWHPSARAVDLPRSVQEALRGASVEVVTNILRHAQARRVWFTCEQLPTGVRIVIRDDGRGLDPTTQYRIGLADVVIGALDQVDGTAHIESNSSGTTVTLVWQAPKHQRSVPSEAQQILIRFTTPFLLVFWVFTAVRFVVAAPDYQNIVLAGVAFGLFTALVALLIGSARRGPIGIWLIGIVLITAPAIYELQKNAGAGPDSPWADWSSEAIAALLIVVIGTGPFWAWFAAIGVWLVIQGNLLQELVAPGFAILVAIGVFGVSFRRNAHRSAAAHEDLLSSRTQAEAAIGTVRATQARAEIVAGGHGRELLTDIAEGRLDPADPQVQKRALAEERLLRAAMRLDPAANPFHHMVGRLAVLAYAHGVELDIDVAPLDVSDRDSEVFAALAGAIITEADGPGRMTTHREDEAWVLTFAIHGPARTDNLAAQNELPIAVSFVPEERLWFIEWRVRDAARNR